MGVLGSEPRSSGRASCAPNHGFTSLVLLPSNLVVFALLRSSSTLRFQCRFPLSSHAGEAVPSFSIFREFVFQLCGTSFRYCIHSFTQVKGKPELRRNSNIKFNFSGSDNGWNTGERNLIDYIVVHIHFVCSGLLL